MATFIKEIDVEENKSFVQSAIEFGISHATQKLHLKRQDILYELKEITSQAFDYFLYGFAKNFAAGFASINNNIKEAYVIGMHEAEGRERDYPIILLLVAERRTAALEETVAHVNRTITKSIAEALDLTKAPAVLLDVQIIETAEKNERRGLSSFIYSWWAPAIKVLG
jgi:hypothetical protein